ncbi:MAG: ABC transporter substrate-binding protein [Candidatus Dactylopiibacterium carminicum]|uniref:ABC transporter substrate-binding protein n=1 Tax=Candidatus Dactylopiibacterium carminicum TaxID=857335 RepID=A0A272EXV0_9RHOO|nr:ABC transporter substrate-binding protein [Candidatus Dactylopiibacterium carminicum]KAF7600489.1 ABC transporter substrate-binding protein [Candidatus Dactylopiibacterium carminicum]PAS94943.1 MAG: ABC transporter substrate-binding protein [Candidatus Dactylopiibacterium carminicum]PAT00492.1 MAG: ABC transporter substrate-binding protein [Candidatus Dactylopiibacterium carminicum]
MKRVVPRLAAVCGLLLMLLSAAAPAAEIVDLRGRKVSVPDRIQRISIDDGRYLVALSLIHADPVKMLAAWPRDINRIGPETHAQFLQRFPALAQLPQVASSAGSFNLEAVLSAAPDVAVVSLGSGPSDAQVAQLQAAGIPVVFIDFFTYPFKNQAASLRILGRLTGAEAKAEAFVAFREQHLQTISRRVAKIAPKDRPTVFLEAHAGMTSDCCNSPGKGNVGDYIEFVGGHNIGADVLTAAAGKLNLEYVISRDPRVYIATGGPHLAKSGGLVLGVGYDAAQAQASLARIAGRQGIAELTAVRKLRTHGLAHQLINSPIDIVAIEVFARWVHPELFRDLDPARTLDEINRRFLVVPYTGTAWVDLRP